MPGRHISGPVVAAVSSSTSFGPRPARSAAARTAFAAIAGVTKMMVSSLFADGRGQIRGIARIGGGFRLAGSLTAGRRQRNPGGVLAVVSGLAIDVSGAVGGVVVVAVASGADLTV
ncbi:MAG: hypothetical protein QOE30_5627, partial [Mycobacterium sp.]|uniref:hypothetical protein n=1 Tax=Mycobacterium sp. TaxID=1785 RepID=UPI0028BACDBD